MPFTSTKAGLGAFFLYLPGKTDKKAKLKKTLGGRWGSEISREFARQRATLLYQAICWGPQAPEACSGKFTGNLHK